MYIKECWTEIAVVKKFKNPDKFETFKTVLYSQINAYKTVDAVW